jgi:hypothetical protein
MYRSFNGFLRGFIKTVKSKDLETGFPDQSEHIGRKKVKSASSK